MKNTSFLSKRGTAIPMVALACLLLLPAGCSFAPHYARPAIPTPAAFKELTPEQAEATIGWKVAEPKDDKLHARWWDLFHDPGLAALEDRASVSNQTVAAALANFLAARAVVKQNLSDYFPTVTAGPAVTRSRQPASRAPAGSSAGPATLTEYALPFDAAWEPDLWGRIRNSVRSASLEAQATRADLENARLAVQAEAAADTACCFRAPSGNCFSHAEAAVMSLPHHAFINV